MKNIFCGLFGCMALALMISPARGQSLTITLETSFDSSTGQAYEYADTSSDYVTGYYYDLCTYPAAFGEEDDGTWDFYESSGNCGSTDSEVSWYFTTDGTTDFVQFSPQAIEYIDYLVYQVDEDCGFDGYNCEGYFDALEMSVLAGVNVGGGGSWALYGPPAIAYLVDQIEQDALAYQGTQCIYPTAESSTYSLKENTSSGFYGAGFKMALTVPGSANLSGRQVQETLSNVTTSCLSGLPCNPYGTIGPCWTEYSDYPSPSFPAADTWNVHSGNIYGDGTSGPDGPDYMGENVTQANYYQNILNHYCPANAQPAGGN